MDIHMPGMDGLTAAVAIRERERTLGLPRTPIIAVTASVLSHETSAYFAAGMDDVIAKPIEVETLLATMSKVMAVSDQTAPGQNTSEMAAAAG